MPHSCHPFGKMLQTLTFCSLLTRCTIPYSARHAKRHLNLRKWSETLVLSTFWLRNVLRATTACTCSTSQRRKVLRTRQFFVLLTSKCASRHNGVHLFDIATSKSAADLVCFVHFDFELCFAPQRRALFRHLTFQKWSGAGVFCTFWLGNVLRATTACNFSSLIWPAGSAPAALARLLIRPPQIIGKTQCFATFLPFRAPGSFFFWDFLFLLLFSDSSHLCFSSVHIVGSLTSKLPSSTSQYSAHLSHHLVFENSGAQQLCSDQQKPCACKILQESKRLSSKTPFPSCPRMLSLLHPNFNGLD